MESWHCKNEVLNIDWAIGGMRNKLLVYKEMLTLYQRDITPIKPQNSDLNIAT